MTAADLLDALRSPAGLTVLEVTWVAAAAVWMVSERRSPAATMAWILALASMPLLGAAVYLGLGPRRLQRKKLRMSRARMALGPAPEPAAPGPGTDPARASQLMRLATRLGGSPPARARSLTLLPDGDLCYDALVEAIGRARDHVHAEYYIFEEGQAGRKLREALTGAARRGVEVKLLLDAAGSARTGARFLGPLRQAGARVELFNPVLHRRLGQRIANFRTHRKIVVVDGLTGFVGGINVSDDHSRAARGAAAWRDTHLRIEGGAVQGLQVAFLEDWFFTTRAAGPPPATAAREARYFPEDLEGDHLVQVVASGPDQPVPAVEAFYLSALSQARERIWITTPYFVPDEPLAAALQGAALRGVDVQLLLPVRTDSRLVDAASRTYHDALLAAGAHLHLYGPPMVHAKTCVVDRDLAVVGSANLDHRSMRLNFEVVAAVHGGPTVEALARLFEEDRARARPKSWREAREPLGRRLFASAARLLAPQL